MKINEEDIKKYLPQVEKREELSKKYEMSIGSTVSDLATLLKCVSEIKPGSNYVEIGVSHGSSIIAVATFRSDVSCYGIEIEGIDKVMSIIDGESLKNVTIIQGDATEICKTWNEEIDLLFIDGNHYAPQVFYDFIGWLPYVKKGSKILFHDYEQQKFGPQYDVHRMGKVLKGHKKFEFYLPAEEDNINSSILIITKL